ncbi:hypothetical protein BDD12DRAFT_883780 [Trichophaea hybrida]|nr:hypothetical protein BDD12DRAFT_883780 [Trichophaea hybrida]
MATPAGPSARPKSWSTCKRAHKGTEAYDNQKQKRADGKVPLTTSAATGPNKESAPISIAPVTGPWRDQPFFKKKLEKHIQHSPDQTTTSNSPHTETPNGLRKTARQWTEEVPLTSGPPRTLQEPHRTEQFPQLPRRYSPCPSIPKSLSSVGSPKYVGHDNSSRCDGGSPPQTMDESRFCPEDLAKLDAINMSPGKFPGTGPHMSKRQRGTVSDGEHSMRVEYCRTDKSTNGSTWLYPIVREEEH